MVDRHALSHVLAALLPLLALPACGDEPSGTLDVSAPAADAAGPAPATPPKVLIIGLDGLEMRNLRQLSAAGRLPHLSALMEGGVASRLGTVSNASPIIWTTVATGVMPPKHGIEFFRRLRRPAASTMRKRPAIWNILSHHDRTVGILGWWASFPAERVNGYLVSPYVLLMPPRGTQARVGQLWKPGDPHKTYPPDLQSRLLDLMFTDDDLDLSKVRHLYADKERTTNTRWVLAKDYSYYRMALRQMREQPVELVAVYFQGIDAASHDFERHVFGKNVNLKRKPKVSEEEAAAAMARVEAMYVYNDDMVGGLVAQASPDTDVIVLSDHGWNYDGTGHWNNDPGVFLAKGPSFVPQGDVAGFSVVDVTPVVLAILGVPLSRDFDGKVPAGLLREDLMARISYLDDYGIPAVEVPEGAETLEPEDELMMERLKSLGYVK